MPKQHKYHYRLYITVIQAEIPSEGWDEVLKMGEANPIISTGSLVLLPNIFNTTNSKIESTEIIFSVFLIKLNLKLFDWINK